MTKTNGIRLLTLFGVLLFVATASAVPVACPVALFDFYETNFGPGSMGCTQGNFLFNDFIHTHDPSGLDHPGKQHHGESHVEWYR